MFYTLTTPIVALVAIVLGWFPDFTEWFQLVEFDAEYRVNVIKVGHGRMCKSFISFYGHKI